jgi:hypothetical protein
MLGAVLMRQPRVLSRSYTTPATLHEQLLNCPLRVRESMRERLGPLPSFSSRKVSRLDEQIFCEVRVKIDEPLRTSIASFNGRFCTHCPPFIGPTLLSEPANCTFETLKTSWASLALLRRSGWGSVARRWPGIYISHDRVDIVGRIKLLRCIEQARRLCGNSATHDTYAICVTAMLALTRTDRIPA